MGEQSDDWQAAMRAECRRSCGQRYTCLLYTSDAADE